VQPLKLTIPGDFWDTQLYEGRLYLFQRSGDILTLNWDRLIDQIELPTDQRLAMVCGFLRSDLLYQDLSRLVLADPDIRSVIGHRFSDLANSSRLISADEQKKTTVGIQENPFPFPHSDLTIYMRNMYSVSRSGVFRSTCNKHNKNPVSSRPSKKWDGPVLAIDASYGSLALAAGDEGLFELPVGNSWPSENQRGPAQRATLSCADCTWAFYSIYGSSHSGPSYLAAFSMGSGNQGATHSRERKFQRLVTDNEIFQGIGYSWGNRDRLYQAQGGRVRIRRYLPDWGRGGAPVMGANPLMDDATLQNLGEIEMAEWKGDVISGAVTLFGIVIECEHAMVVVQSDGNVTTIAGEPINWRVFPRSKHYENQLHLIYEDRLDIYSFNQDYLVSQSGKRLGFTYFPSKPSNVWSGYGSSREL
jgi:hypothetical protein